MTNAAPSPAPSPSAEPSLRTAQTFKPLSHPAALLLITFLVVPVLLVFLGTGDPVDMMELFNLIPVREAFRDGHWLMPTLNGAPRLEKPPLPVWFPAGSAALFHSGSLWILRLPSLLVTLLTCFATYGIGSTLFKNPSAPPGSKSERYYALLAALLLPAMLMFNRQARLASYDIYATAFLTCAAYFLLLIAERGRTQGEGAPRGIVVFALTVLAGACTGLSTLSKGPVPVATVMVPLGIWLMLFHRRAGVWVGVLIAALVSLLTFMPWLVAIGGLPGIIEPREPAAWKVWSSEFIQFGTGQAANTTAGTKAELTDPPYYYLQMLIWVLPLTPSLIAGLILPFTKSQGEPQPSDRERRGRWLLWLILVLGLLMLTVPSEKKPRYALQLFPYAALLCAAVWQEFVRFPASKKVDAGAGILLASQALFFIVPGIGGVLAALWVAISGKFFKWPIVAEAVHSTGVVLALLLFGMLTAAGVYLWHLLARRRFAQGAVAVAMCSLLFIFTIQFAYKSLPETHTNPTRLAVETALQEVHGPVYTLAPYRPWLPTLYFANRILPACDLPEIGDLIAKNPGRDLYLVMVSDTYDSKTKEYARMPGFDAALEALQHQTSRPPEERAHWVDEGRRTALFVLRATPATP